jgi:hypothetical protein
MGYNKSILFIARTNKQLNLFEVRAPRIHQLATLFKCVGAPVSEFSCISGFMSERQFTRDPIKVGFVPGPITECATETVERDFEAHCSCLIEIYRFVGDRLFAISAPHVFAFAAFQMLLS